MSYVEHGPRIFLTNRQSSGMPLIYGDYVLPKKRLEGRLKLHDSCSDVRAWSPNSLENSRYFRELSEHDSPIGKIIPFNVVIDNIIRLNSQAQHELQAARKELQKYKSLELTSKQEEQLKNLDSAAKGKQLTQKNNCAIGFLKDALRNVSKSGPLIQSNSCLSIRTPCDRHLENSIRYASARRNQSNRFYSYSLTTFDVDPCLNNYNLISSCGSTMKALPATDYNERIPPWIEYIDVAVQVEREMHDAEVQVHDQVGEYLNKIGTISAMLQRLFASRSSDKDNSATDLDKNSLRTNNQEGRSSECDVSSSDSSQNIGSLSESDIKSGSESDFDSHDNVHKEIIIRKDAEIVAFKHELCVRDAELKELGNMNKHLEILVKEKDDCIHTQQENLKVLHEKLFKLNHERNSEVENLKRKLYSYKYMMEQLKQDLNEKCECCYVQSQEIGKLRLHVEEVTTLQLENDALLKKLQEMEGLSEKTKNYNRTMEQLRNILQERDKLKIQNYEQDCMLKDQEEKLNQLLKVINEMSIVYNEQMETKNMLENLKDDIRNKNVKISQYENQLASTKQEISDFFNSLKCTLSNLEELNDVCDDVCSCTTCDLDIGEEASNILWNINIIMTRFQSYKIESQNLLQQVGDLQHYIENDKRQTCLHQSLNSIICGNNRCNSETDLNEQDKNISRETEFNDIFNSPNTKNFDCYKLQQESYNYILELSKKEYMDKAEKEIIKYFVHFLIKLRSLTQNLQIYIEIERPLMIKQTYYVYEILKNTQSAINVSQDVTLKKKLISELYNQHKEEHRKYDSYVKQLPNDLLQVQNKINEFLDDILYQLLDGILHMEGKRLHDGKINQAFEIYLRTCIDRINTAVQGAEDQHMQIVETIEEQQKELRKKHIEIAKLRENIAQQIEQKGEGDCLNDDESKNIAEITEQLSKATEELDKKDMLVLKLEEQLQMLSSKLSICDKNCSAIEQKNKNLENIKNQLLRVYQRSKKQLTTKNKKIKKLSQQIREFLEIKNSKRTLENKIKEMEKGLIQLQFENNKLERNIMEANVIISTKDETITKLKNNIDKIDNILSQRITEYESIVEEKHCEVVKLENENKLLNEKVRTIEDKLVAMNQTIASLTEQNDKINVISAMQEDLSKLDKDEKKLKTELNNLRTQFINDQNNNRKLDNNLETFLRENDILKSNVEYWKTENSELSIRLCNEMIDAKLQTKLYGLTNKIYGKLLDLQKQSNLERDLSNSTLITKLRDKYTTYQNKGIELTTNNVSNDLKPKTEDQKREIRENEIEEIEMHLPNDVNIKEEMLENYKTFKQFNPPEDNLRSKYTVKHLEDERIENENKIRELLSSIESRDCEIQRLQKIMDHLTQENTDLRAVLKSQIEEYQNKLVLMKKNYDSSLNALCERHKANVEILQKQFEDDIKSERNFDLGNWLLSLNMKELMELHKRLSAIINNNCHMIHMENEKQCLNNNDTQQQYYSNINVKQSSILKERTSHLQDQWQCNNLSDTHKYPTLQTQNYRPNLEYNFGYLNSEGKSPELETNYEKEKQIEKNSTIDQQRWSFINQCSAYHKLSNIYEYTKSLSSN
ncbi:uncharacterized protein LOC143433476 [Xylocopa sonorina]|uniref:uncharacterized protein LOC143433476 n=1 Tax=Xylocopa sonorina TaxID=1818115 RepID=UPI00403AC564